MLPDVIILCAVLGPVIIAFLTAANLRNDMDIGAEDDDE